MKSDLTTTLISTSLQQCREDYLPLYIEESKMNTENAKAEEISNEPRAVQGEVASPEATGASSNEISNNDAPTSEIMQPEEQSSIQQKKKAVVAPLPLEWTRMAECAENIDQNPANIVRYPWDVTDIDPNETELTIVGTAGEKITRMGSNLHTKVSPNMTQLVLRSHLIHTMEGIGQLKHLELLELYDNQIDELRELDGCIGSSNDDKLVEKEGGEDEKKEKSISDGLPGKNLRVLDISYNSIRDMGPISVCANLQELYIAQNKIKSIKGIKHLKLLRKIDLGANRIRVMDEDELSGLVNLEELWLGKNKIEHIGGLSKLTKLRRLDVQANRLTKIENLEAQVDTLEELYLAHNGIDVEGATCETGLALPFTQLNTIDMSRNRLVDTSPFGHIKSLTDLWISGNDIKTFHDIEHIRELTELDGVYLEYNPVASEFEYRKKVAELAPSLTQIDATMIWGLAQHGYGLMGSGDNLAQRMKQMQDTALRKAQVESQNITDSEVKEEEAKDTTADDVKGE